MIPYKDIDELKDRIERLENNLNKLDDYVLDKCLDLRTSGLILLLAFIAHEIGTSVFYGIWLYSIYAICDFVLYLIKRRKNK